MRNDHCQSLECLLRHPERSFTPPEPKRVSRFKVNYACVDYISSCNQHIWRHMHMAKRNARNMDSCVESLDLAVDIGKVKTDHVILNGVQWMAGLRDAMIEHAKNKSTKTVKFQPLVTIQYICAEGHLGCDEGPLNEDNHEEDYVTRWRNRHSLTHTSV